MRVPEGDDWLIQGLRQGEPRAVQAFCRRYGPLLEKVADRHLRGDLRRRIGPESIGQSVCRSFLRRAQSGEFQLADSESLWRLLCAITLTKVREKVRFHRRQKRSIEQEVPLAAPGDARGEGADELVDPQPSPAEAAEFNDQLEQLLTSLDEEERSIVELKLQQYSNVEVADRMGCSERTVRRLLRRVQARLEKSFAAG